MLKYTIKEKNDNALETILEQSGNTFEVTPKKFLEDRDRCEKRIKELESQKEIETAKMANIDSHNPFIDKMSDEDMHAVHMYWESKLLLRACVDNLKLWREALDETNVGIDEIKNQTGLDF